MGLEEGIDGMIHVSAMSWTRQINHPSEVLKKGDEVEAIVLEIKKEDQRVSLGTVSYTHLAFEREVILPENNRPEEVVRK